MIDGSDHARSLRSLLSLLPLLAGCGAPPANAPHEVELAPPDVCASAPAYAQDSTFFASATVEDANSVDVPSNGDLWPSCSAGTALYTAWGDGFGFVTDRTPPRPDIGIAVMEGSPADPPGFHGRNIVSDRAATQKVFHVWSGKDYYQKPTGMLCMGGKLYVAVQDIDGGTWEHTTAATVAESSDGGATWVEDAAPMFTHAIFTTIMFLDEGSGGPGSRDGYVYAYGLDWNFRGSPRAPTSQALYLARIPRAKSPRDRSAWEFFAGDAGSGAAAWTRDIAARRPVLVDCTRRHARPGFLGEGVVAQGSVVYDAPLARYLYTSWSEYTFEFYEAPAPWGPWRRFLSKDFGPEPWTPEKHGGYATVAPSLYIGADGKTLWVQSNTWSHGVDHNNLAYRKLLLETR
jgi:hypothetical protein